MAFEVPSIYRRRNEVANSEKIQAFSGPLTRAEAGRWAGVTTATIDAEIRDGHLRATRIRRRVLIQECDFQDWLARCRGEEVPRDAA